MNERLGFWRRLKLAGGIVTRGAAALDDVPDGILPPARRAECDPLTLSTVFRGVQVLQTAITGLPINETRNGIKLDTVSALVQRPDINRSRRDFLADMVASMVLDGNAFVRLVRYGGEIVTCEVLPPQLVTVSDDGHDPASPRLRYAATTRPTTSCTASSSTCPDGSGAWDPSARPAKRSSPRRWPATTRPSSTPIPATSRAM